MERLESLDSKVCKVCQVLLVFQEIRASLANLVRMAISDLRDLLDHVVMLERMVHLEFRDLLDRPEMTAIVDLRELLDHVVSRDFRERQVIREPPERTVKLANRVHLAPRDSPVSGVSVDSPANVVRSEHRELRDCAERLALKEMTDLRVLRGRLV